MPHCLNINNNKLLIEKDAILIQPIFYKLSLDRILISLFITVKVILFNFIISNIIESLLFHSLTNSFY
jgi:hypothetical protein